MNRRGFLGLFGAGVAAIALEQAIPLGRVWSFPSRIVVAQPMSVGFIKAFDPYRARWVARVDVRYGSWPSWSGFVDQVDSCELIEPVRPSQLQEALDSLAVRHHFQKLPATIFDPWHPESENPQIAGAHVLCG